VVERVSGGGVREESRRGEGRKMGGGIGEMGRAAGVGRVAERGSVGAGRWRRVRGRKKWS